MRETDITPQDLERYNKLSERYDSPDFGNDEDEDWEYRHPLVDIEIGTQSSSIVYAVDMNLAMKIRAIAKLRGESAEKLMEAWLWDRLRKEAESDRLGPGTPRHPPIRHIVTGQLPRQKDPCQAREGAASHTSLEQIFRTC